MNVDDRHETVAGLPVLGSVGVDGKLALTPEGTRILIGETRYGVPLADLAAEGMGANVRKGSATASALDDMGDALCESAALLEAQADCLDNAMATCVRVAANEARGVAIRLYGVARELRGE